MIRKRFYGWRRASERRLKVWDKPIRGVYKLAFFSNSRSSSILSLSVVSFLILGFPFAFVFFYIRFGPCDLLVRKRFGLQLRCFWKVAGEVSPARVYTWWFSFFFSGRLNILPNRPFSCSVMMVEADLDVLLSVTSIMGHRWLHLATYSILLPLAHYFRSTLCFISWSLLPFSNVITNPMKPRLRFWSIPYMRGLFEEMWSQFSLFLAMEKLSSRLAVFQERETLRRARADRDGYCYSFRW
ncbi:hypothetical protein CTA2_9677 [Colletotrichum tanaceti]|nr:hypothetical protein CTA2_9677 [Colletotrichum tanaceti]